MGLEINHNSVVHHQQTTPSVTWVISHGLGTLNPIADCWIDDNGSKSKALPLSVVGTDENTCTITFSTAKSGEAALI